MNTQPHIVVIGAGILGASIAFHLTLRGAQVTMVDAGNPGQKATRLSFAWMNAFGKNPYHYFDLNRRSMDMWDRFVRRLEQHQPLQHESLQSQPDVSNLSIDVTWGGELHWAVTEAEAAQIRERTRLIQSWGYSAQLLDAAAVKRLEPSLVLDGMLTAVYADNEGHVHTGDVVRACLNAVEARGAELCMQTPVTGFEMHTGSADSQKPLIETVLVAGQEITCDMVVIAGGMDTPELAEMAGIHLPLYHTFGATILTEPLPPLFESIALYHSPRIPRPGDPSFSINIRQFSDGVVMVQGSSSNDGHGDPGATDDEVAQMMTDAAHYIPKLSEAKVQTVQRGRRPIPQDDLPIIGFAEGNLGDSNRVSNLYVATTHSGVTLAPLIGEFAALEMMEDVRIDLLQPYRLSRFTHERSGT
ncbi:MAG: FAD-dependent oxidoreductase [Chloroflexota bacterium]